MNLKSPSQRTSIITQDMGPLRPLAGGGTQVNATRRVARAKRCHLTSTTPRAGKAQGQQDPEGRKVTAGGGSLTDGCPPFRPRPRASERANRQCSVLLFLPGGEGKVKLSLPPAAFPLPLSPLQRPHARVACCETRGEESGGGRGGGAGCS